MGSAKTAKAFIPLAKVGDLPDGTMKEFAIDKQEILLARVGNKYYAANNTCPHLGGRLARGQLEGTIVACPLHASRFDLTDGHVVRWTNWTGIKASLSSLLKPPHPLTIYTVKVEGDTILVEI
ncbi:MAG: Rieske 2Fe-2S domain-containing protein [Chloroflexota bacterium]